MISFGGSGGGHETTARKIQLDDDEQREARVKSSSHSRAGPSLFLPESVKGGKGTGHRRAGQRIGAA